MHSQSLVGKIQKHLALSKMIGATIGTLLFFGIAYPIVSSAEHLIERFTAQETYFEYIAVKPTQSEFKKGERIRFNSFIEYKKIIDIRWEDTLFCEQGEGTKKYTTQFWPENGGTENKSVGYVNMSFDEDAGVVKVDTEDLEYWEIFKHMPDPEAAACYVCGSVVGYTAKGYPKPYRFCTETFPVNK